MSRPGTQVMPSALARLEWLWVVGLLALHATLALWVARENSVTFDESFHVPAGVRVLVARDFMTSYAQPPSPRRSTASPHSRPGRERFVGYVFMRTNAARFRSVYGAA